MSRAMWTKVAKSTGIMISGAAISNIFMFVFRYSLMRNLSTSEYGKFALVISFFTSLQVLAHSNIGIVLSKYLSEHGEVRIRASLLTNGLIIILITSSLACIFFQVYLIKMGMFSIVLLVCTTLGIIMLTISAVISGALRGLFKMRLSVATDILNPLARVGIISAFMVAGLKDTNYALFAYFGSSVLPFVFAIYLARTRLSLSIGNLGAHLFDIAVMKSLLNKAIYITISNMTIQFMWFYSRSSLNTYSEAAVLDVAFLMYSIIGIVYSSFILSLIPHVSYHAKQKISVIHMPNKIKLVFVYLVLIVGILIMKRFKIGESIMVLLGLRSYIHSLPIFYFMCLVAPFDFIFSVCSGFLQGLGRTQELFKITSTILPIHVIGTFLIVKTYGLYGVTTMFVITYCILGVISFKKLKEAGVIANL